MPRCDHLTRLDAAESAFFQLALEHLIPEPFDVKRAPLKALSFIPVDPSADPGDNTVVYQQFDHTGTAILVSNYSDDLPRADVRGREFRAPIKDVGAAFGYSVREVQASAKTGRSLPNHKAIAAERAIAAKLDDLAAFGDASTGLLGLLNQPNALEYTVPQNSGETSTKWEDKTAEEMLADMHGIAAYIYDTTNEVEKPDTLILPPAQFALAHTKRLPNSDTTVLEHFLRTSQHVKHVDQWHRLKGIGDGGADRMVCYRRSLDALRFILPIDLEMLPPQEKNLEFVVPVRAACGGVVVPYPLSICYADGV